MLKKSRFPKSRKKSYLGYGVGVPHSNNHLTRCLVLWESSVFKDLILLGISDEVFDTEPSQEEFHLVSMIYTAKSIIRAGHWKLLGHESVSKFEPMSERIIAGEIWIKDEYIRDCTDADRTRIPQMDAAGKTLVENYIKVLHGIGEDSHFSDMTTELMTGVISKNLPA